MDDMIGHNAGGTALHRLNSAVAALGLALQDARTIRNHNREQMIIVARALLLVDEAAAGDEGLADAEIRSAGITSPTDLIASATERTQARWLARGGVKSNNLIVAKNINEIKDLSPGRLNGIEGAFLIKKKFAKITSYGGVFNAFAGECKSEIRKVLSGEGGLSLDGIRGTYAGTIFLSETVEGWISDAEYQRSDEAQRLRELNAAWKLKIEETLEEAKDKPEALERLAEQVKQQLAKVRALAAQKRAEAEARKAEIKLTPEARKRVVDAQAGLAGMQGATDDDF